MSRLLAVEIEICHGCNQRCFYCPNSRFERLEQGQMDPSLFERAMRQLKDLDFRGRLSYHFYNEPLLSPNLELFIGMTRGFLPLCKINIFTNGTLIDEARLRDLFGRGVDKLIVTRQEGTDLAAFEAGLSRVPEELRKKVRYLSHQEIPHSNRGGLLPGVGRADLRLPLKLPCYIPTTLAVITMKGNVLPCYEDFRQTLCMGNIGEKHLLEIWQSPRYEAFRQALKNGKRGHSPICRGCNNTLIIS